MMRSRVMSLFLLAIATNVAANDAVHANPSPSISIGLTSHGSDWLWAVFAVMLASDLAFIFWHTRLPRGQRVFHQLPIIILTTATIAYFSMASNLGATGVRTEFNSKGTRAVWYARYIDWIITTPLLLLELLLATGMPLADIVTVIFMDIAMIVVGLLGALVASSYKWGYFTLGMFFEFYIWWVLLGPARRTAGLLSNDHKAAFTRSAVLLSALWLLYPICWALSEGSNIISVTGEMIFYGVLDILAKPLFCYLHVRSVSRIPYESYGFNSIHNGLNGGNATGTATSADGKMLNRGPLNSGDNNTVGGAPAMGATSHI